MAKRRPSGDGMVRKREDGRWEGRIVVGHKENGDSIFRYLSAKSQKALMKKLHRSIEEYRDVDLSEDSRMPLGEWLDRWLEEYVSPTVRESTLRGYRQYIECYIKPRLGDRPVCKVTAADVQALYQEVQKNGRKTEHPEYGYGGCHPPPKEDRRQADPQQRAAGAVHGGDQKGPCLVRFLLH